MVTGQSRAFAALLKQYRLAAGLTQEELAERAHLSVRAVSDLERGVKSRPYPATIRLLADALHLTPAEQVELEIAAGRRSIAGALPDALPSPAPRHNLPQQTTSFVGREQEQRELLALLGQAHLVTLTGTGGVGKTRLAVATAARLVDQYRDGVWLVELAYLADPALVPTAVVQALDLREERRRPLLTALSDYLKNKSLLLVLDNCEHVVAACAVLVGALLRACPDLQILTTSREALGVSGERLYRVPSLTVPDLKHLPPADLVGSYEAMRLFLARAQARRREFTLTPRNAHTVAAICARLDGIPLAIELAAARVSALPVEEIAERLDQRFRLLTGGPRDAPSRQQTLRATLDWSWVLLDAVEQVLLQRLSVFAGGWTLAAAEAVCAGENIDRSEVFDLLDGLVNKSLAQLDAQEGEARYGLLETVRQYAAEYLATSGQEEVVRDRHLAWCVVLGEEAEPHLTGPKQAYWLARLEREHDNLRAALGWSLRGGGKTELGLRLAGTLWRFWQIRGYLTEGRGWLETALAGDHLAQSAMRARALDGAGNLAETQGDYGQAIGHYAEALALWRALEDKQGVAYSLNNLGNVAYWQGDYGRARALHEESLALKRELGDTQGVATSLNTLGLAVYRQGDYGRATVLHEESLALKRQLGNTRGIAVSLLNLGAVASSQGDYIRAATLLEECLALARELGDTFGIAISLNNLGNVAGWQGDHKRAKVLLREALLLSRGLGARELMAEALEGSAWIAIACRQAQQAAQLAGAAEALREAIGVPLWPEQQADHDKAVQAIRDMLGEDAFTVAWAAGRALSQEAAVSLATVRESDQ